MATGTEITALQIIIDRVAKTKEQYISDALRDKVESIFQNSVNLKDAPLSLNTMQYLDKDTKKAVTEAIENSSNDLSFTLTAKLFTKLLDEDLQKILKEYVDISGEDLLPLREAMHKIAKQCNKIA